MTAQPCSSASAGCRQLSRKVFDPTANLGSTAASSPTSWSTWWKAASSPLQSFHTVHSAIEVDLTGQVKSEVAAGRYLGAIGGQTDFVRAGVASPGGHSIIALPSITADELQSRIVATLDGRAVSTARAEVDIIVTEHGSAHLRGVGLRERARRLIAVAHPAHRESLERSSRDRRRTEGLR